MENFFLNDITWVSKKMPMHYADLFKNYYLNEI